jgi:hypothetical protein
VKEIANLGVRSVRKVGDQLVNFGGGGHNHEGTGERPVMMELL